MTLRNLLIYLLESNNNLDKEVQYSFKRKDGMNIITSLEPYDITIDNENITINI